MKGGAYSASTEKEISLRGFFFLSLESKLLGERGFGEWFYRVFFFKVFFELKKLGNRESMERRL